uniref:U4/U6.U5 small nuclear ribonucleoprotein 27kDa protein domain-containing protein n=1 Tax=Arcella intermedia TaxID=1963864 RepID=A0A6B2LGB7_9EUKA
MKGESKSLAELPSTKKEQVNENDRKDDRKDKEAPKEKERDKDKDHPKDTPKDKERDKDKEREKERKDKERMKEDEDNSEEGGIDLLARDSSADIAMMKMMGLPCGFNSTKGKHVEGNDWGTARIKSQRLYRQYMNRKGGFNRKLDPDRNVSRDSKKKKGSKTKSKPSKPSNPDKKKRKE